jgi:carboxyl-terminal processing protease
MQKTPWKTYLFLLFLPLFLVAKPAELTPSDACLKIDEILHAHATHHTLNQELIKRTLINFLQELDPNYCYLTEPEVIEWIEPSDTLITLTLKELQKKRFTTLEKIHLVYLKAIERRRVFEEKLKGEEIPEDVDYEEFKDMSWAKTEEDLFIRLKRIQGLQMKTARRVLSNEDQLNFQKRLEKRRINREEAILSQRADHSILTYVLKAVAASLDSQTSYFTSMEANQLMMQVQKRLFGIGAQLADNLDGLTIVRILEDSPLSKLPEVEMGDRIIAVNQEPVIGMDIIDAVELIRGPEGTPVTLTLLRQETQFDVQIIRGAIVLKESRFEANLEPFGKQMIAILRLHSFYQDEESSSSSDLREAIEKLQKEHLLSAIILDLRSNTGGLLPQAVSVAGLFMNKGVVVSIKDNTGFIQRLRNLESSPIWNGPLMILTNKLSASASEIVAQTLQEYGRALVVGDSETFGKGTFQTFTLESSNYGKVNVQGEYKVTRGCYYTVSGKTPQKVGLKPQIIVPGEFAHIEIGERFAKYPLEPDEIAPCFDDDLSDIPLLHRHQISKLYKPQLQPIVTTYEPFLPQLSSNASLRVEHNSNKELSQEESDLQLQEAVNLMKDLLFLMRKST